MENKKVIQENRRLINDLVMNWQNTMANIDCMNKEKKTYTLHSIKVESYGFSCRIYAPWGLNIFNLENLKPQIETGCKCQFLYIIPDHNQFAMAKFVKPEQVKCNKIPFAPHKVKPWEVYAGVDVAGDPIVFNVNKSPQILLAGQTRRGKNGALDHMMTSWLHWCEPTEVNFYLFQCAKNDLIKYKDCKQVRAYIEGNLNQMITALEHILNEMERRKKLFEAMISKGDGNDNILHYNKKHPANKLAYIYLVIDEFIELMPDADIDDKDTKKTKNKILRYLQSIGQWGGSYGCNYIICHQKPEAKLCPTFIKNQSSIRICFGFDDDICCQIVLGAGLAKMAHKLPPRKAFYSDNDNNGYLYTTDLTGRIRSNIEKNIDPKHRTLFSDLEKLKKDFRVIQSNEPETSNDGSIEIEETPLEENISDKPIDIDSILEKTMNTVPQITIPEDKEAAPTLATNPIQLHFDKVDPITIIKEQQEIKESISNIPNFVPFIDYSKFKNIKITDKTKLDPSKTEKPKKDGDISNDDAAN